MSFEEKCDLMAELSEGILQDPHSAFVADENNDNENNKKKGGPNKMDQLLEMAMLWKNKSTKEEDYSSMLIEETSSISQMACTSLLAIFKDLLPSYRIRLPTQEELKVRVSKETKRLWDYERQLLYYYQIYIQLLETILNHFDNKKKNKKKRKSINEDTTTTTTIHPLFMTSFLCHVELFKKAFAVQFHNRILKTLLNIGLGRNQVLLSKPTRLALVHVFHYDYQGQIILEIVRAMARIVKNQLQQQNNNNNNHRCVIILQTWHSLSLSSKLLESSKIECLKARQEYITKTHSSKGHSKQEMKELKNISRQLHEGSGQIDGRILAQCQSETLQTIMLVYFAILKQVQHQQQQVQQHHVKKKKKNIQALKRLLPPTLQGLAQFCHLVHFETVLDVLNVLKQVLIACQPNNNNDDDNNNDNTSSWLSLESALYCISCAFTTLQGPGRELQLDVKEYTTPLYMQLNRLVVRQQQDDDDKIVLLLISCLGCALLKRREFSPTRCAAFWKRIQLVSLFVSSDSCRLALLAWSRQLMQKYTTILSPLVMETESMAPQDGEYNEEEVHDPEEANPFASSAWELCLHAHHVHPTIREQATKAATIQLLQLPMEDPERLYRNMSRDERELYIPFKRSTKKHPLTPKPSEQKKGHVRFITPRKTSIDLDSLWPKYM